MSGIEIDPLRDARWSAFTEAHRDASVFHSVEWLQALKDCYGYEPRVITTTPPGAALTNGIAFCQIRSWLTGNRLVALPFSDHCEPLLAQPEELDLLLEPLTDAVDAGRWKYVEIRPTSRTPQKQFGAGITYYMHHLDLRRSEEHIFASLHKGSVQRKIRRAEREGLRYEEGASETLLNCFYKLLIATRRRQGLPPQPLKWFRSLIACMGPMVKIRIAFKGEIPVASILTISNRTTMVYKYGCSDDRYKNLGGTALLFWRTIQEAKARGIGELDMGRSDTDNLGLVTFKDRWGAERSTVNYWRYPAPVASNKPRRAMSGIKRLVAYSPEKPLVIIGNLLYRHIG